MAIETNEFIDVKELPPFKRFIMSIGAIPTSYLESMTYAELLMWFCDYLQNTILPTINNNADALQEVINYLKTLDLQDEVNNKLDEMAESGELQEIIGEYLNATALWCFDNVASLKEATNLIDGSYARTLGYYSKNDGGGSLYKITNEVDTNNYQELLNNNLYATLITKDYINVLELGVKTNDANSATVNSQKIQYAVDHYKSVYIPENIYINATINVNNQVNIYGNTSQNNKTEDNQTPSNVSLYIADDITAFNVNTSNVSIKDLTIYNENKSSTGIKLSSFRTTIDNCNFINLENGINTLSDASGWLGECRLKNNTFIYCNNAIQINGSRSIVDSYINNNIIDRCTYFINGTYLHGWIITENHDYSSNGIYLSSTLANTIITNNYFDHGHTSIEATLSHYSTIISNNTFLMPDEANINVTLIKLNATNTCGASIVGNIITNYQRTKLNNAYFIEISGNATGVHLNVVGNQLHGIINEINTFNITGSANPRQINGYVGQATINLLTGFTTNSNYISYNGNSFTVHFDIYSSEVIPINTQIATLPFGQMASGFYPCVAIGSDNHTYPATLYVNGDKIYLGNLGSNLTNVKRIIGDFTCRYLY